MGSTSRYTRKVQDLTATEQRLALAFLCSEVDIPPVAGISLLGTAVSPFVAAALLLSLSASALYGSPQILLPAHRTTGAAKEPLIAARRSPAVVWEAGRSERKVFKAGGGEPLRFAVNCRSRPLRVIGVRKVIPP
jgi:hypothetical protein